MKPSIFILSLLLPYSAIAQINGEEAEIQLASEAAPSNITDNASYMVFRNGTFEHAIVGSNNFTCLVVSNPEGRSEPSCLNEEAMRSVFLTYEMEMKLRYEGYSNTESLNMLEQAYREGGLPTAETGSLVYMMSPNNKFYNFSRNTLGSTRPHQMYFFPKISDETFSLSSGPVSLYQGYPHLTALLVYTSEGQ